MKLTKFSFAAVLALSASRLAAGASIPTCDLQKDCIIFTQERASSDPCGGTCEYRVCLKLDTNRDTCVKDGATISHVCEPIYNPDECAVTFWGAEVPGPLLAEYCQVGVAGETLSWILKDGSEETGSEVTDYTGQVTVEACNGALPDDAQLTCGSAENSAVGQCAGGPTNAIVEKVWSYTIPVSDTNECYDCPAPVPAPVSTPVDTPVDAPVDAPVNIPSEPPTPECTAPMDCPDTPPDELGVDAGCVEKSCTAGGTCTWLNKIDGATCGDTDDANDSNPCYTGGKCTGYVSDDRPNAVCVAEFTTGLTDGCNIGTITNTDNVFDNSCEKYECVGSTSSSECQAVAKQTDDSCTEGTAPTCGDGESCLCYDELKCCNAALEELGLCTFGRCYPHPQPVDFVCRASSGCCDVEELCPGPGATDQYKCPADAVEPATTVCRETCEECNDDPEEYCDGEGKSCPTDVLFKDQLCLVAGQSYPSFKQDIVTVSIVYDGSSYVLTLTIKLVQLSLDGYDEAIKVHIGTGAPPALGQYGYKLGNNIGDLGGGVFQIVTSIDYDCGTTPVPVNVAVHLDVFDEFGAGQTAWAFSCEETDTKDPQEGLPIMSGGNRPRPVGWGRYFALEPCCEDTCEEDCAVPTPPGPTPPGPSPTPTTVPCPCPDGGVAQVEADMCVEATRRLTFLRA